jgi:UPF0271 protein
LDLNADLGQSFGPWAAGDDTALIPLLTSANVACGLHAGDPITMLDSCRAAVELDVTVGAHLGYRDLPGYGRRFLDVSFDELFGDVLYQLGALDGVAHAVGASVDYVKLHGALFARTLHDGEQASAVVAAIQAYDPGLPVLGLPDSALLTLAAEAGQPVFHEAYVDRVYLPDGRPLRRDEDGALLVNEEQIVERAVRLALKGEVEAVDGSLVRLRPDSLYLSGDAPSSARTASAVREALLQAGVELEAFA